MRNYALFMRNYKFQSEKSLLWICSIGLAVVFVLAQIQLSSRMGGRLAFPSTYDDVIYFLTALSQLEVLHQDGLWSLLQFNIRVPPHAPMHTLLAMLGFSVFGTKAWAANAATVIPLALLISLFLRISRLPLLLCVPLIISFLLMPYAEFLVAEFRPDGFCGLFVASGAMIVTLTSWADRWRMQMLAGLLFAAALLAKPSFLPLILVVMAVSVTLSVLPRLRDRTAWSPTLKAGGITVGSAIIIALPYYVVGLKPIISYIYNNTLDDRAIVWGAPLPLPERLTYYLTGPGAQASVGWWLYVSLAALFFTVGWSMAMGRWSILYRIGSAFLSAASAYSILTFIDNKTPYIGLGFTAFIFVGLLSAMIWFCRLALSLKYPAIAFCAVFGVLVFAMTTTSLIPFQSVYIKNVIKELSFGSKQQNIRDLRQAAAIQQTTLQAVVDALAARPDLRSKTVYLGLISDYINFRTLTFMLMEKGALPLRWLSPVSSGELRVHMKAINQAQYAVLFSAESGDPAKWLPSYQLRDKLLEIVPNAGFEEIARLRDASGHGYIIIFQRKPQNS